ncbi:alpha/beta fold hydrolase [Tomitella cavernea]|uniref:AB hydrolase-1 domain-containing protein n=1 Tax=Tomitella cavernea TaxID=1387982 RepID=A0ABP9D139_9ACTN|nr:alpha/beta fold hydrolase [Tomitella cavernea]
MATFILIPGAGGAAEVHWREVAAELAAHGHDAVPVELPGDDPALGLPEYAAIVDDAIGDRRDVVLVAQSLGGFTAPMVGSNGTVGRIVLLNAMIPVPGETPAQWPGAAGSGAARRAANAAAGRSDAFDLVETFLHDVPEPLRAEMIAVPHGAEPALAADVLPYF